MKKDKDIDSKASFEDNCDDQPPSYEEACQDLEPTPNLLEPAVLLLGATKKTIYAENDPSTPLYRMSRDVLAIPQQGSSVKFERVDGGNGYAYGNGHRNLGLGKLSDAQSKDISRMGEQSESQSQHLFYLVHPENARYRKDIPAQYYITAKTRELTLGNMRLDAGKSVLGKVEFKAVVSEGRTMYDKDLFDEKGERVLFCAKPKWACGGRLKWVDGEGRELAVEEEKGEEPTLVVTERMEREVRDALVAAWVLKLWHDTMESGEAKRECKFDVIPTRTCCPTVSD